MRIAFRAGLSSDSDWVLMALSSLTHHSSPARPGSASLAAVIDWENHRNIEIFKIGVSTDCALPILAIPVLPRFHSRLVVRMLMLTKLLVAMRPYR